MWYKQSLDLSSLKQKGGPSGYYGTFISDFSNEEKKQLQQQFGVNENDIGIKFFRDEPRFGETAEYLKANMIAENLSLYYIGDYINKHTNLRAPIPPIQLSLSSLLMNHHNFLITQKKTGMLLSDVGYRIVMDRKFDNKYNKVKERIEDSVREKLRAKDIYWGDCHTGNFLITKQGYTELMNLPTDVDLNSVNWHLITKGATIIDFGSMDVRNNDELYNKILKLKEKIIPLIHNQKKLMILSITFDQLLGGY